MKYIIKNNIETKSKSKIDACPHKQKGCGPAAPTMMVNSNMSEFCLKTPVRKELNFVQEVISRASFIIKNLLFRSFQITRAHENQIK